jgi:hypothetical protein
MTDGAGILGDFSGGGRAWTELLDCELPCAPRPLTREGSAILLERMNVTFGPADAVAITVIYDRHMPAHVLSRVLRPVAVAEAALAGDPAAIAPSGAEAGIHFAHAANQSSASSHL